MAKNKHWNETELTLLTGVLENFGNPNGWTAQTWDMVKAQMAHRSQTGIYQRAMAILRSQKANTQPEATLNMAKGA